MENILLQALEAVGSISTRDCMGLRVKIIGCGGFSKIIDRINGRPPRSTAITYGADRTPNSWLRAFVRDADLKSHRGVVTVTPITHAIWLDRLAIRAVNPCVSGRCRKSLAHHLSDGISVHRRNKSACSLRGIATRLNVSRRERGWVLAVGCCEKTCGSHIAIARITFVDLLEAARSNRVTEGRI